MNSSSERLASQVEEQISSYFGDRSFFACIYGSYANGKKNEDSDIDILIATKKYSQVDLERIKSFIINLHLRNGLKIDNEVPFENKLLINYKDFKDAVNLKVFIIKEGRFVIPKVVKTKEFLESHEVKLRLALNAITSPHIFLGGDSEEYLKLKKLAETNITFLALNLQNDLHPVVDDLIKVLMRGKNKESGEMYLGYKRYPKVVSYLKRFIKRELISLSS